MPGVRYDYDNYIPVKPQYLPALYRRNGIIFSSDQTSMITAGYNRYYGGNINMGLRMDVQ